MNFKKILFIINPVSGIGRQKIVEKLINNILDATIWLPRIEYTERAKHATEISKNAAGIYDIVVAVGGDGSVNEVARGIINSSSVLGILPTGSGNGFARSLNIPVNIKKAMIVFNNYQIKQIDTVSINDEVYVNIAGIGFDAHIAHLFATFGKRGFFSYLKLILKEFSRYKGIEYSMVIEDKKIVRDVFLTCFANSTQWGNNGVIAPMAKCDDGMLDICIVHKFPAFAAPFLVLRLYTHSAHKSKFMEIFKASSLKIICKQTIKAHFDGEPVSFGNELYLKVNPLSLKVAISK
ncbi:MAG: YegS/Rv2252/BmrU family lipid kinase [Bacteroidia bacterium]|nr:YegS/Rv2252/BmrU family lipid kinase [Bacteroidia bacterium]